MAEAIVRASIMKWPRVGLCIPEKINLPIESCDAVIPVHQRSRINKSGFQNCYPDYNATMYPVL